MQDADAESVAVLRGRQMKHAEKPVEIRQANAAVAEGSAAVTLAEKEHERIQRLVTVGVSAKKDQERADADLAQARARQASAQEALSTLKEGTRQEEIDAQQAKVN